MSTNQLLFLIMSRSPDYKPKEHDYSAGNLLNLLHRKTGITPAAILSKSRKREVVYCRYMLCVIQKEFTNLNKSEITRNFNMDHATYYNAIKQINHEFAKGLYTQLTDTCTTVELYKYLKTYA